MLLLNLLQNPLALVAFLIALLVGITVHEFAHAWTAQLLGDPTAKYQGRVSLNPLAHLDPLGTILLFVAGFGWGKPVPVNPQYFERPALDELLVALAGPASNFLTALVLALLLRLIPSAPVAEVMILVIHINLYLMVFNLVPIPPLDGSKIFGALFGPGVTRALEAYSLPLMLGFLLLLWNTGLGSTLAGWVAQLAQFLVALS